LLIDKERNIVAPAHIKQDIINTTDDLRCEPQRWLIDEYDPGPSHERAANDKHLLLATGKFSSWLLQPLS
jgi:hypothetical protein